MHEHKDVTTNYEGSLAYNVDALTELYLKAASCLVGEQKFYESGDFVNDSLITSVHNVLKTNPEFVLQLAIYCREQLHLRSVPLVLCAEYANVSPGTVQNARKYISRVIQRADELTELIAYQLQRNKIAPRRNKLPMAIKHGVAGAFGKFDEYQLAKYNRPGEVKLRDTLFLTHPKPMNVEMQKLYDKIASDTLETPETWEVMRSTGKMTWHDVINNVFSKNGYVNNYMAQVRNLRNILQDSSVTNADIELVCKMISNSDAVSKSKMLPFRFLSAYRIVEQINHPLVNSIMDSLETAASVSIDNMPRLPGVTLIACDVSGSMQFTPISKNSTIYPYDIGMMLWSMSNSFCNTSITGIFGDIWEQIPMTNHSGILANVMNMRRYSNRVGFSTNGYKVIQYLNENNIEVDRIMVFTDCQMWDSMHDRSFATEFVKYQRRYPSVKLYSFDLMGYGNVIIPQDTNGVCLIGGWSEKVFDFVQAYENLGKLRTVDMIKEIKP